jgi:2-polyprenyl-3-methyl-5-hydroxy-6-metoxy-1,4-benzoquinol methylase
VSPVDWDEDAAEQHRYPIPYHWCMSTFHRYVVERAVERVASVLQDACVLEVGCGDGFVTALLARYAARVYGFDISERAITFARLIVEEPHVTFAVGRAGDTRSIAESLGEPVDVVAAFEVVEHLSPSETNTFLGGARESLAPQRGYVILTTPNGAKARRRKNPHHAREYAPVELETMLRRAGFGEVHTSGLYLQPLWPRLEHLANTVPFRAGFRSLARAGRDQPDRCRTLVVTARASSVSDSEGRRVES